MVSHNGGGCRGFMKMATVHQTTRMARAAHSNSFSSPATVHRTQNLQKAREIFRSYANFLDVALFQRSRSGDAPARRPLIPAFELFGFAARKTASNQDEIFQPPGNFLCGINFERCARRPSWNSGNAEKVFRAANSSGILQQRTWSLSTGAEPAAKSRSKLRRIESPRSARPLQIDEQRISRKRRGR